jgi:Mce-associated membrane protein
MISALRMRTGYHRCTTTDGKSAMSVHTQAHGTNTGETVEEAAVDTDATTSAVAEELSAPSEDARDTADTAEQDAAGMADAPHPPRRARWKTRIVYIILPVLMMMIGGAIGYLKYADGTFHTDQTARAQAVDAAKQITTAMLSYKPDSVDKDLRAAQDRLTGDFRGAYTALVDKVVIPGAKERHIISQANIAAAGPASADAQHAVVLLFVDQTITIGTDPPTNTASSVRVSLDKVDGRWMVSKFEPI